MKLKNELYNYIIHNLDKKIYIQKQTKKEEKYILYNIKICASLFFC